MTVYSYSKLTTYEQCPLKYKFRYVDHLKPPIEMTIEAFLGKCVHAALEFLYQNKMQGSTPSLDDVLEFYLQKWHTEFSDDLLIVDTILKAEDYMHKGAKFLTNYYLKHHPFSDITLATEKKVSFELKRDCKLVGFIDRLSYNSSSGQYEIHDYKTGALKTQKHADSDRQLALYSLALKHELKDAKEIMLIWHYLDHDQYLVSKRTELQLEELKMEILHLIQEIEGAENRGIFPPQKSALCKWCEFKPICPAWQKQANLTDF